MGRELIFLKKGYKSATVMGSGKRGDRGLFKLRNGEIMITSATVLAEIAAIVNFCKPVHFRSGAPRKTGWKYTYIGNTLALRRVLGSGYCLRLGLPEALSGFA
jgi:hypothetical protein